MSVCPKCEGKGDSLCGWHYLLQTIKKLDVEGLSVEHEWDDWTETEVHLRNGHTITSQDEDSWKSLLFDILEGGRLAVRD